MTSNKTTIIGISGKKRHGKDATCALLQQTAAERGVKTVRRAFADALKEECTEAMERVMGLVSQHHIPDADTTEGHEYIVNLLTNAFPTGGASVCAIEGGELLLDWFINDLVGQYLAVYGIWPLSGGWVPTFNADATKPLFRKFLQWYGTEYRRNIFGTTYWLDKMTDFMEAQEPGTVVIAPDTRFPNEAEFCRADGFLIRVWRPGMEDTDTHISEVALDNYEHFNATVENKAGLVELQQAAYHTWRLFEHWRDPLSGARERVADELVFPNFPRDPFGGGPRPNPRFA